MQEKPNLSITKTRPYVWRVNVRFGHQDLSYIDAWNVTNADTGKVIEGGHDGGNNTRSGSARFDRKKDAQAWMDGYLAAGDVPFKHSSGRKGVADALSILRTTGANPYMRAPVDDGDHAAILLRPNRALDLRGKRYDETLDHNFVDGAQRRLQERVTEEQTSVRDDALIPYSKPHKTTQRASI